MAWVFETATPTDFDDWIPNPQFRGRVLGNLPRSGNPASTAHNFVDAHIGGFLHPLHTFFDARSVRAGLCTDSTLEGTVRAHRYNEARVPQRTDSDHHDRCFRLRGPLRRCCHHREGLRLAWNGPVI